MAFQQTPVDDRTTRSPHHPGLVGSSPALLPRAEVEFRQTVDDPGRLGLSVEIFAVFGLAFLLFLAGSDIDLRQLRGNPLQVAVLGYLVTLGTRGGRGRGFGPLNWVNSRSCCCEWADRSGLVRTLLEFRTPQRRSVSGSTSCSWTRSLRWPATSVWKPFSAQFWPARSPHYRSSSPPARSRWPSV